MSLAGTLSLRVALQEWAACVDAMLAGELVLAVRKGGIHERHGGLFALEHDRFLLLPSHLHQDRARLLPAVAARIDAAPSAPAGTLVIPAWAEAARIWKMDDLARVQALGDELAWTADELAARFRYRDQPWLYVVALRVHRLPTPAQVPDRPAYAGCRSWIPLQDAVAVDEARPVLDDAAFARRLDAIARRLDP